MSKVLQKASQLDRPGWIPVEITYDWDTDPYAYQTEEELMPGGGLHGQLLAYLMELLRATLKARGLMLLWDTFMLYRDQQGIKFTFGGTRPWFRPTRVTQVIRVCITLNRTRRAQDVPDTHLPLSQPVGRTKAQYYSTVSWFAVAHVGHVLCPTYLASACLIRMCGSIAGQWVRRISRRS